MSDIVVLVCILWAVSMSGIAWHYFTQYNRAMKGGVRLCAMLVSVALGKATIERDSSGDIVIESDEHKLTIGRWEDGSN